MDAPIARRRGPAGERPARRALARLFAAAAATAVGALLPGLWHATLADGSGAGTPGANLVGAWSRVRDWPIVAIHAVLAPNGRLLTFGAEGDSENATGAGAKRHDTWDPRIGLHATVAQDDQDYFCSASVVVPDSSTILVAGGDDLLRGSRGNALASFYDPDTGRVEPGAGLGTPRWYPTATTLPDGRVLLQGGRFEDDDDPALTPEVFDGATWTDLPGATSAEAWGRVGEERRWWYPRAFVDPDGRVFTIAASTMFTLDPTGDGRIDFHGQLPDGFRGGATSSAVMYAPGRILQVGGGGMNNTVGGPALASAAIIDIGSGTPVVTPTSPMNHPRHWANATVLPDGTVLVNGGSAVNNELLGVAYPAELWDPETRAWTVLASEDRARLYHSSAVLLADGRVFSGGGGAPGPVANLDAQLYSPPYLFDSAGAPRTRPVIEWAPPAIAYADRFELRVAPGTEVARVTLVKTGATTHSFNMDQRFLELDFEIEGDRVAVDAPANPNLATPGHYLLSVIDADGAVSESAIASLLNGTRPEDVERLTAGTVTAGPGSPDAEPVPAPVTRTARVEEGGEPPTVSVGRTDAPLILLLSLGVAGARRRCGRRDRPRRQPSRALAPRCTLGATRSPPTPSTMPVTLHDFVRAAEHGDDGIAGYLEPGVRPTGDPHRFLYWRSSNAMLPAFVNCLEGGGDMRRIYTNHERTPWVRPRGPGVKRRDVLRADEGDGSLVIEPVPMTTRSWPARVVGPDGPAPLSGGLHAAALASTTRTGTAEVRGGHDASGPGASLRHYALAARTLTAASAASGFAGVHDHVGALLVGDTGEILAAGINTGSYRHAEVSLLLSWFRDHPEACALPSKSVVLSTLTPCRQCTRYLSLAKAPDTLILFDEADAGRSGRVGERIAGRIEVGIDRGPGSTGTSPDASGLRSSPTGTRPARGATAPGASAAREAERRAVRNDGPGGRSRMARSREARRTLLDAADAVHRAAGDGATRHRGAEAGERRAEEAVLTYLATWIRGATRVA